MWNYIVHIVTNSMEFSQDSANPMAKLMLQVLGISLNFI